ncbi:NAD-dependent epimerase/dehydratase family protein [Natronorubrum sp. FCH18a]|uniref:NAD-dependent epimerase/dehydratase family protein n=1 Tax=Natronorubrum sp. FCH18a TaxID=3447018 RepID=UPI003F511FBD
MQNARILITGGTGFIGSNLANKLAEHNEVIAVDNGYLGTVDNLTESVTYVEANVLDKDLPTDVDIVYHLAALSSRQMVEKNPQQGARVNIEGFVNVVEQAMAAGCETIVYASTSSAYGSRTTPTAEDVNIAAATGYDASMLGRERYGEYYNDFYDKLTLAGMRFFSVYQGYGGTEGHKGTYANTVSQFADDIANGNPPVLWGDGTQTRDFTHIDDIVRGLELAADHELAGVYNLGTGNTYSFNETIDLINDVLGTDIEPTYEAVPLENYVFDTCADTTKIREETGWEAQIDFEEGVERVCRPYILDTTQVTTTN